MNTTQLHTAGHPVAHMQKPDVSRSWKHPALDVSHLMTPNYRAAFSLIF
jgi:hypothetical protein